VKGAGDRWPELPWTEWEPTISTLHMWTQIVGKVRMTLAPPLNHWWHVPLYVSARGLTTTAIPYGPRDFQVDFDLIDHRLLVTESGGGAFVIDLGPKSVAEFYRQFMDGLRGLGIDVRIWTHPVEVAESIPFESDEQHASYEPDHAHRFWLALTQADRVMTEFRARFLGKASPVHFFWGGFDHATTRFSGRRSWGHPGGAPNCAVWVMEEAYSHEVSSAGWWPQSKPPGPAFYSYMYPEPVGFDRAAVRPEAASYDQVFGEFVLPYDAVRAAADPDATLLDFFQSTYEAGVTLAGWDRAALEPGRLPERPPRSAWSNTVPEPAAHAPDRDDDQPPTGRRRRKDPAT
jgi:hypothetical protein